MNRKNLYKNLDAYAETKRRQQTAYRKRTGAHKYRSFWTKEHDKMVLEQSMSDRELSEIIHHSVAAIQHRRSRLRGGK